jgi:hypothetical protein
LIHCAQCSFECDLLVGSIECNDGYHTEPLVAGECQAVPVVQDGFLEESSTAIGLCLLVTQVNHGSISGPWRAQARSLLQVGPQVACNAALGLLQYHCFSRSLLWSWLKVWANASQYASLVSSSGRS